MVRLSMDETFPKAFALPATYMVVDDCKLASVIPLWLDDESVTPEIGNDACKLIGHGDSEPIELLTGFDRPQRRPMHATILS